MPSISFALVATSLLTTRLSASGSPQAGPQAEDRAGHAGRGRAEWTMAVLRPVLARNRGTARAGWREPRQPWG